MKHIYIIGGTMGVGKSTVSRIVAEKLKNSVFLDGDWCWDAHPFQVTEETKKMVLQNICFLLNQFIHCSAYENIVFCWVLHEQGILEAILQNTDITDCTIVNVSLTCDETELKKRLLKDVKAGVRQQDVVERSVRRITCYATLNTVKIDTNGKDPVQVAEEIISL